MQACNSNSNKMYNQIKYFISYVKSYINTTLALLMKWEQNSSTSMFNNSLNLKKSLSLNFSSISSRHYSNRQLNASINYHDSTSSFYTYHQIHINNRRKIKTNLFNKFNPLFNKVCTQAFIISSIRDPYCPQSWFQNSNNDLIMP